MKRTFLLTGTALLLVPSGAWAQQSAPPAADDAQQPDDQAQADEAVIDQSGSIVVTGKRSILGTIPPENVLDSRDVQATGATDINELLDALAPQIGSSQGRGSGPPVMLLDGQRISGFRELRDIPTEAIQRVEILPEEVALRYGYRADQKVVNFVLWPRFRSTAARIEGSMATEGGYVDGEGDATRLMIGDSGRTSINLHAEGNGMLTEDDRDIVVEEPPAGASVADSLAARSLIGSKTDLRGTVTVNRSIGKMSGTGNVELRHVAGRSLIGLGETLLVPLARNTTADSAHAGGVLSGNLGKWTWSATGNADAERDVTRTDQDSSDPRQRAESRSLSADIDATANGALATVPAGQVSVTLKGGASTLRFDTQSTDQAATPTSLSRTIGEASASVDLPVSKRNSAFAALGNLTLNGNAGVQQLSDFGTLTTVGAGANWSPFKRMNMVGSWNLEEGAPTVHQLGDPVLETPDARIFDFTTGQTVLVTSVTGGNPALNSDRRTVWKLGGYWNPIEDADLTLRGEYVRSRIDNPIANFPGVTEALEQAFPDRFVRDSQGKLVRVDLRPVNYDNSREDTLRIGFDFTKPLKSKPPSAAAIAAFRARREGSEQGSSQDRSQQQGGPAAAGNSSPPQRGEGASPPSGGRGGGGGFGRFGGGGRNGGRLTFSLTDTVTLAEEVTIRDGLKLDYLHGDAFGRSGGRPRHQVEGRAGYFNNGVGAFLSANWTSGTDVTTTSGDELRFSPLATFDLRLFANLGQRFEMVAKHPWLRGTSVRLEVKNLLDSRPSVRNSSGGVPINYQPDLLDPLGRTIGISIRKLFLPPPSFFRRSSGGGGDD